MAARKKKEASDDFSRTTAKDAGRTSSGTLSSEADEGIVCFQSGCPGTRDTNRTDVTLCGTA